MAARVGTGAEGSSVPADGASSSGYAPADRAALQGPDGATQPERAVPASGVPQLSHGGAAAGDLEAPLGRGTRLVCVVP